MKVPKQMLTLRVNGQERELYVYPYRTLLDTLRDDLGLTGTKESCSTGDCGACTVIMDGRAVNACLVPAVEAEGREITTIEGLKADPLQQAFVTHGATQCGFCSPGMILSARALLDETPEPTDEQIKEALAGNLCRCTGYYSIIAAVKSVAAKSE